MPSERRNTRSSKDSTAGERSRSDSQKSSAKDKSAPSRATSSKSKTTGHQKRGSKDLGTDKPKVNGAPSSATAPNGTKDVTMANDKPEKKEGDEEMTVVVPPSKGAKLSSDPLEDPEGDLKMADGDEARAKKPEAVDPKIKTVSGECRDSLLLWLN